MLADCYDEGNRTPGRPIRAALGGVDMDPERPFAKRHVHDLDDRIRYRRYIGIGRHDGGEGLQDFVAKSLRRSGFILGKPGCVGGPPGMGEVVGAAAKAPGTMIEVSMPQRVSSRAYWTAIASIPAFAAK
jgi:hypothetical protein